MWIRVPNSQRRITGSSTRERDAILDCWRISVRRVSTARE
jgi:hypothetical protein